MDKSSHSATSTPPNAGGANRHRQTLPTPNVAEAGFRFFPQLNHLPEAQQKWLGSGSRLFHAAAQDIFNSGSLQDRIILAIAAERLLPLKEVLESFEMFARVRKHVRSEVVADLCCGHGLVGVLYAIFERKVDRVLLIDQSEPDSRQRLLDVVSTIAPWVPSKVQNHKIKLLVNRPYANSALSEQIVPGTAVVSAHACGVLSDYCINVAIESQGPLAILPCCYPRSACQAPLALQSALGLKTAFDVDRTYRLHNAGYHVRWDAIPALITPMNRILCARKTATDAPAS